jgi:hypothetical protein
LANDRSSGAAPLVIQGGAASEEFKDAILVMIVERFGDRPLDWQTVEQATALVNFEIKQAAMFAPR